MRLVARDRGTHYLGDVIVFLFVSKCNIYLTLCIRRHLSLKERLQIGHDWASKKASTALRFRQCGSAISIRKSSCLIRQKKIGTIMSLKKISAYLEKKSKRESKPHLMGKSTSYL